MTGPSGPDAEPRRLRAAYDAVFAAAPLRETRGHYRWALAELRAPAGTRLLDVGCGAGDFVREARRAGLDAWGIDFSAAALARAVEAAGPGRFVCADAEALPFPDASFGAVSNLGSLEHFAHPDRGAAEMARVLAPGGRAAFLLPNSFFLMTVLNVLRTGGTGRRTVQPLDRAATRAEWAGLLEAAGFRIERTRKYNYKSRAERLKYKLARPFIPANLSYAFLFLCRKS